MGNLGAFTCVKCFNNLGTNIVSKTVEHIYDERTS